MYAGCTEVHCNHDVYRRDECGLKWSFEGSKEAPTSHYDTCCNFLACWGFQQVGLLPEGDVKSIGDIYTWLIEDLGGKEVENGQPLEPGDICFYRNFGHVDIIAEKLSDGTYLKFNGGASVKTGSQRGNSDSSIDPFEGWSGGLDKAVRLNWGKREESPYKGYLGNEAVVSPVTGILIDYGTYPINKGVDEDGDGTNDVEERINVDLKYGPSLNIDPNANREEGSPEPVIDFNVEKRDWADKVGYATIFVLNKEVFEMLDGSVSHKWRSENSGNGLLSENGQFYDMVTTETQFKELTEAESTGLLNETIYGYKEFAEMYERFGISGYFLYIDGFKCELPDTSLIDSNDDGDLNDESRNPRGTALTFDSFKISPTSINYSYSNDNIQSLYEADDIYTMASKKATEKINIENTIKTDAYPALAIDNPKSYEPLSHLDELVFIKEGTVLGRTYTDKELVEERLANGDDPRYNFEYYTPSGEVVDENGKKQNADKVVGNYIMTKLLDPNKPVENIEDYMKLDVQRQVGDQEYEFREGDLEILADAIQHEGCGTYCGGLLGTSSEEDALYLSISTGYTIINKLNTDGGYWYDYNDPSNIWDSTKSPLYNLLCRIPDRADCMAKARSYGYTTGLGNGFYAIAPDLRKRIDDDALEYCDICYEAAEYIMENDSLNFTNNGKFGSEYPAGTGMPHTCWEQGGNYSSGTIWYQIPSVPYYIFDPFN